MLVSVAQFDILHEANVADPVYGEYTRGYLSNVFDNLHKKEEPSNKLKVSQVVLYASRGRLRHT